MKNLMSFFNSYSVFKSTIIVQIFFLCSSFGGANIHPDQFQNSRKITKEGMTISLPSGWKLEVENMEGVINVYSAENRNAGLITFYRMPIDYAMSGDEFVKTTSKEMIDNIQSVSTNLAISGGIRECSRKIKDFEIYGSKETIRVKQLVRPRTSYNLNIEYYQLTSEQEAIVIILVGESGTSDMSDISLIMNSFEIK